MNIYKNFLDKKEFAKVKEKIMSDYMPWYFNNGVNKFNDGHFQFTFVFLNEKGMNCPEKMMDIINPILEK